MRILGLALLCALLAPSLPAQTLKSTFVAGGLSRPSWVGCVPGDTSRIFALEQDGRVRVIAGTQVLPTPFLDLNPIVGSLGNEQGLLGLAFDPNYSATGFFYVSYTDNNGACVVARYTNLPPSSNVADPSSALVVFGPLAQPQSNHNGGCIRFGPDGMLYVGLGDGGGANDTGAGHDTTGNAQSMNTYLGKLLRIDPANPLVPPAGNPFPASAIPLAWDIGLRNPWRFSFDGQTGELYLGDVGQNAWEELDVEPAGLGGVDYGWRCMEGAHCTGLTGCTCGAAGLALPAHEYAHTGGNCAIIGGEVYRGAGIPALQGAYIFADYCSGRIWTLVYSGGSVTQLVDRTLELAPGVSHSIANPVAFGADGFGELLIVDQAGGEVYRVGAVCTAPNTYCLSNFNSTGFAATMTFSGSGSLTANSLSLLAVTCPPGVPGLFLYGDGQAQTPFGNGFLCIASNLVRQPPLVTNAFGDALYQPNLTSLPGISPGSVKNFQFWYRDVPGGGALFNTSDALHVVFCN
ncbi:MAG: PQQ-dependent sugar dehydrogenase [Planctomycetes bacterium]|nr:PQQ-dependent sugar dehydrogenase [Planctomycetota bacterium]